MSRPYNNLLVEPRKIFVRNAADLPTKNLSVKRFNEYGWNNLLAFRVFFENRDRKIPAETTHMN